MATKRPVHQLTAAEFEKHFPDEAACCAYLVGKRWPKGVHCPRCGAANPTELKGNPWHWQCYECAPNTSYRFSHITGTIFENTNKPLRDWFKVIHLMLTSKKGMSALQIFRYMGFGSYKTAWYMCHRVRMGLSEPQTMLGGMVEVDETFIGGKAHNRHYSKRDKDDDGNPTHGGGTVGSGKTPVIGAVSRKGRLVARMIERCDTQTLEGFVHHVADPKTSTIITDEYTGYRMLGNSYPHAVINHHRHQYVVGAIHTNTIEGFWSILKRGVIGTYHKVSAKYLGFYVAEFQFRYNNRDNADIFGTAIEGA
jgi:hypothetical protein